MATYKTSRVPIPQLHGMKFTPVEMEIGKRKQEQLPANATYWWYHQVGPGCQDTNPSNPHNRYTKSYEGFVQRFDFSGTDSLHAKLFRRP